MSSKTAYDAAQMAANYPTGAQDYYWFVARNLVIERVLRQTHGGGIVFDLGCGRGFTLAHLLQRGFDGWGSDLAQYDGSHPMVSKRVLYGQPLGSIDLSVRGKVTTVLLLDVIEHLPDPSVLLCEVREAFPSLRRIIVTVPARMEIWSNYDEFFGHFRRYDAAGLRDWAQGQKLRVSHLQYFFHSLYWPAWAVARLGRTRATEVHVPGWPALHRFMGRMLALESVLLPCAWRGSSLLGVFHAD